MTSRKAIKPLDSFSRVVSRLVRLTFLSRSSSVVTSSFSPGDCASL